jgi:hypothetical protein
MEKVQENKLSMYLTVQKVTNSNVEVWKDLPAFKNIFNEYEGVLSKIKAISLVQEKKITGAAKDKKEARNAAIEKCLTIIGAFHTYAVVSGNNKLADSVSYSADDLYRSRDTILASRLNIVHEIVREYIDDMAEYGVVQEDLDELAGLTEKYAATCEDPREAITNRARATKQLKDLIKNADTLLRTRLDKLIILFKSKQPDFWQQFKNARKIVNLGYRKRGEHSVEEGEAVQTAAV